jgi:hypothetical protein
MENTIRIYQKIAQELKVINNPNADSHWYDNAIANLEYIEKELLPYGSGIDNGCQIDLTKSTPNKIVIRCDFHHMNENGYYTIWTTHECIITPDLGYEFDMKMTGRDKNGIKDYLCDAIYSTIEGLIINKKNYTD